MGKNNVLLIFAVICIIMVTPYVSSSKLVKEDLEYVGNAGDSMNYLVKTSISNFIQINKNDVEFDHNSLVTYSGMSFKAEICEGTSNPRIEIESKITYLGNTTKCSMKFNFFDPITENRSYYQEKVDNPSISETSNASYTLSGHILTYNEISIPLSTTPNNIVTTSISHNIKTGWLTKYDVEFTDNGRIKSKIVIVQGSGSLSGFEFFWYFLGCFVLLTYYRWKKIQL